MSFFFFFNDTATTEIYTLSLHDALPIFYYDFKLGVVGEAQRLQRMQRAIAITRFQRACWAFFFTRRSEEHTSELQSRSDLVCRLLLEKKNCLSRSSRFASNYDSSETLSS